MSDSKLQQDRALLAAVQDKGLGAKLGVFTKLSGPGWLQSAITLGGGSLGGSLYIGIIGGYDMLWLQPLMMILGIVMLSAIAYVTLSTGEKPFHSINKHVNPVLGWGWLIAAMIANLVWAIPQFSLGTGAMQQNLGIGLSDWQCGLLLLVLAGIVIWFYDVGGWGIKLFDLILKVMVGLVVLAFFGVVIALAIKGQLDGGAVLAGFIPDFSLLSQPAEALRPIIAESSAPDYWNKTIVAIQKDRMISAAATAVGINMTFLLPYSMLRKGWDKTFRGLATFDLSTGLFVPFVLATSCVVIAAASQFHAKYDAGLLGESEPTAITEKLQGSFAKNLDKFVAAQAEAGVAYEVLSAEDEIGEATPVAARYAAIPHNDRKLAAMTLNTDSGVLALSLENVTGNKTVAQYVFGLGVLGMALSTIIILMLINGFTFTEALGVPTAGPMHRVGSYLPGLTGLAGFLLLWSNADAKFWLVIPTSRIGMMLLPVAYISFFLLINSRRVMGENLLTGGKRLVANTVMIASIVVATYGCVQAILNTTGTIPGTGIPAGWVPGGMAIVFITLAVVVQALRIKPAATSESANQ